MTAVDFSFSRFTVAQLKAAGVSAVARYLTGAGKAISGDELAADLRGGLAVCLVFENSADDASGGFAAGAANARAANAALLALGLPLSTPVYFAADTDYPNPADALAYYQGLASVRPGVTNGCYGEAALIDLLFADGLAGFGWESESTSFPGNGALSPNVALWQKVDGAPLSGTDLDVIEKADFGQLPRPISPAPSPTPPGGNVMAVSPIIEFKPGQLDAFQVAGGVLWHKWARAGKWTNEAVQLPAGFGPVTGTPEVAIIGGACWVTVEDASGKACAFVQTASGTGSSAWANQPLP